MLSQNYWIGLVSRSHVQIAVNGGFIQLNHGKKAPLQRFRSGDRLVMYFPLTSYPEGGPLQAFTAIGVIGTGDIYQVEMAPNFNPYRLDVQFEDCLEAPISPLFACLILIGACDSKRSEQVSQEEEAKRPNILLIVACFFGLLNVSPLVYRCLCILVLKGLIF